MIIFFIFLLSWLAPQSLHSQDFGDIGAFSEFATKITKEFKESDEFYQFKNDLEQSYQVKCHGEVRVTYIAVTQRIVYQGSCGDMLDGAHKINLKAKVKYSTIDGNRFFKVSRVRLRF